MILSVAEEVEQTKMHDRNAPQPPINPKVNIALENLMLGQNMSKEQTNDVKNVVRKFHKAFALGEVEIGTVRNHEVEIKLTVENHTQ